MVHVALFERNRLSSDRANDGAGRVLVVGKEAVAGLEKIKVHDAAKCLRHFLFA